MSDERKKALCEYRMQNAQESFSVAEDCYMKNHFKDSINRSYYSVFYAVKAVLSLEGIDFKRHKDVIAYFNHTYVATEIIPRSFGRKIGQLQQRREKSDYDDFYIASKEEALEQLNNAKAIIEVIRKYLEEKGEETP